MATRTKTIAPRHRTKYVVNRSSRHGAKILAIALHSTESKDLKGTKDDLNGVFSWFNNPASDASAHAGIDGDANIDIWVPSTQKAWTILSLNAVTLNIEFVGRAGQSANEWEEAQIKAGARLSAYWGRRFGLPMVKGEVKKVNGAAVVTQKGIIRHSDLTDAGFGTHTDPGPNFPMSDFIRAAAYYKKNGWTL
jgi:N-acetyl-anhydromuramyl-L-alanine amidase AmpD